MTENIFISNIYSNRRMKNRLLAKIKTYLFTRQLSKIAPDFNLLWDIASMLTTLEVIFLYPNSPSDKLHSIKVHKDKEVSFGLLVNNCEIVFHLTYKSDDDKRIRIDIIVLNGKTRETRSSVEFKDGQAKVEDIHDEQMYMNINDWLMDAVSDLVKEYSKR